jgi:hypothetical protein
MDSPVADSVSRKKRRKIKYLDIAAVGSIGVANQIQHQLMSLQEKKK